MNAPSHTTALPITREEAARLKVSGWDVFQKSHLMYMDGINRLAGVAELNFEAFKAFSDTILISKSDEIIKEAQQSHEFMASGKNLGIDEYPWPNTQMYFGRFRNYEFLKIGCGFELSLKANLLSRGIVIHELDRTDVRYSKLAKEQKNRPVLISELLSISGYMHNGSINMLPGISKKSLKFSTILDKSAYKTLTGLDSASLEVIGDYRDLRNMIHLPGDPAETLRLQHMSWQEKIDFIRKYINDCIVAPNRKIVADVGISKIFNIEAWQFEVKP